MNCTNCQTEIKIEENSKFIKIPDILIFTLEIYKDKINNVWIEPDEITDIEKYIDDLLKNMKTK